MTIVTVTTDATMTAMTTEIEVTTWVVDAIRNGRTKASATEIVEAAPRRATAGPQGTTTAETMGASLKPTAGMTAEMIDEVTMDAGLQTITRREVVSLTSASALTVTVVIAADTRSPRMALVMTHREVASTRGLSKVGTVDSVGVAGEEEEVVETSGAVEVEVVIGEGASREAVVAVVAVLSPTRTHTRSN